MLSMKELVFFLKPTCFSSKCSMSRSDIYCIARMESCLVPLTLLPSGKPCFKWLLPIVVIIHLFTFKYAISLVSYIWRKSWLYIGQKNSPKFKSMLFSSHFVMIVFNVYLAGSFVKKRGRASFKSNNANAVLGFDHKCVFNSGQFKSNFYKVFSDDGLVL